MSIARAGSADAAPGSRQTPSFLGPPSVTSPPTRPETPAGISAKSAKRSLDADNVPTTPSSFAVPGALDTPRSSAQRSNRRPPTGPPPFSDSHVASHPPRSGAALYLFVFILLAAIGGVVYFLTLS
jgi:hypothetical protein